MNKMEETSSVKSPTSKFVIYGMPRLGTSIVLGIESWALFTLYTLGYGVHPFLVGFAIAMGYLSIAFAQFFLGWLSDARYTRWGRRKPYLIVLTPLLGISFIFLLLPALVLPDLGDKSALFMWLLIWEIIFRISYAVTIPYQSWTAEQFEVSERPKVSQFQNIFNFIGNGIMALVSLLILVEVLDEINTAPNVIPIQLFIPTLIFGLLVIVFFYFLVFIMPTEPKFEIKSSMMENLKNIGKNKNFLKVTVMQGIAGLAWSMIVAVMLTYAEVVLNLGGFDYIIVAVFLLLGIFFFLYLWRKLIQIKGKKQTLMYIFIFGILFFPISLIGLISTGFALIIGIIFILGIAAVLGGWFLFPYMIYADIAEDDEKSTGELKAGIYYGFPCIILNIFQAAGIFLLGAILSLPNITVGNLTYSIGLVLWGPICSLILICSLLYTKKFVKLDFEWEK